MSRIAPHCLAAILLSGCVAPPMGPTAQVMPAPNKPFEVFVQDQAMCKQFAGTQVDGGATMSNLQQLGTAAVSTALGAGLGASVRGQRGAEFGGAIGAIGGASMAARGSARDQNSLQGRYDLAYTQCMYAHGNQIAGMTAGGSQVADNAGHQPRSRSTQGSGPAPSGQPGDPVQQGVPFTR